MELYYIIRSGDIIELIILKEIKNKYYIQTLEDILRTNNILEPNMSFSFHSNCEATATSSTFIYINYIYFNKILIPILEKNGFIVMPHKNNKIFIYYIQHDESTIEFIFDNVAEKHNNFIILVTFLKYTLETIKNNNFANIKEDIFTLTISLPKYKIIIQSKYLFKDLPQQRMLGLPHAKHADSIMNFLKLNGFHSIALDRSDLKPQKYLYNKFIPK